MQHDHELIPIAHPLDMSHEQWFNLFKRFAQSSAYHMLLESGRAGRYSFMAYQPTHSLRGYKGQLDISILDKQGQVEHIDCKQGLILPQLREWMSHRQAPSIPGLPDFCGGLMGFFSYDLVREIEQLPNQSEDDLFIPDVHVLAFDRVIVYDHKKDQHWVIIYAPIKTDIEKCYTNAQQQLLNWMREIATTLQSTGTDEAKTTLAPKGQADTQQDTQSDVSIRPSFSEEAFVKAVQKVQGYIAAGDVFQVNLSVRQTLPLEVHALDIYEVLRDINPSPYMSFLSFPDMQIVGGSPEQLIKVKGQEMNTRPLAGTRPRGKDRDDDLRLARELIEHEKERAEHVMLVDLERNDLGKVSRYGSVNVNEFMVIEEYSHVMHIVSNVRALLAQGKDVFDVIEAVFPGGTITGAPKVRTMEIIEELEPVRRGIYTGSIGWIDYNGDMELNIVIRTLLAKAGYAHVQAGAGIVMDSVPIQEYQESLNKAKALWKAYEWSLAKKKALSVRG